jgi:periplasmic protein CpxP/Spy
MFPFRKAPPRAFWKRRFEMTDHNPNGAVPDAQPPRRGGSLLFVLALLAGFATTLAFTAGLMSTAFSHGFGWRHGPMSPAQIDERIDRMTKHAAIELDATADQQVKIASIAKAAIHDLQPLREKAQAARKEALALLTAPRVDRDAIERLRAEQLANAEAASKRIAQALADAADVLTPEQRRKISDWTTSGPWMHWHRE